MNIFNTIYKVEHNGKVFLLHWKNRYGPEQLALAALAGQGVGTVLQVQATRREGRQAGKIAEARAAVDIENAEAVRKASVEEARITKEKGRRLIERQKSLAAAGNIRLNVGSPLVIEAQTEEDIATEIGFILETGREEAGFLTQRGAFEIAQGEVLRKKARLQAISQGILGFGSFASGIRKGGFFAT